MTELANWLDNQMEAHRCTQTAMHADDLPRRPDPIDQLLAASAQVPAPYKQDAINKVALIAHLTSHHDPR